MVPGVSVPQGRVFRLQEVGKDFFVGPTWVALGRPAVVVFGVSSRVDHVVDDGGTAEGFASGPRQSSVVHAASEARVVFHEVLPIQAGEL